MVRCGNIFIEDKLKITRRLYMKCNCKELQEYNTYKYFSNKNSNKVICYNKECQWSQKTNICFNGKSKCMDRKKLFNALDWYKRGLLKNK
jgi:hypothetical protein